MEETNTTTPPDQVPLEPRDSPFSLDSNLDVTAQAEEKVRQMEAAQQVEKQSATGQYASDPEDTELGQTIRPKALPMIPFRTSFSTLPDEDTEDVSSLSRL